MMRLITAVVLIGALAAAAWWLWAPAPPPPQPERPAPAAVPAPQPPAPAPVAAEPPPAETADPAPPAAATAPRFDVIRVEPDGSAMVAGVAEPGAEVTVRVDGEAVATLQADGRGEFAGFLDLPRSDSVRRLDLTARGADGAERAGDEPAFVSASAADAPEPEAPAVALAGPGGVTLVQEPGRDADGTVTLDMVSYSEGGTIAVSGRGNVLRLVRLYANAVFVAETMVREDGTWSIETATALPPGSHTLRVDEIGADGTVTSRIEAPFVREEPDTVALRPGEIVVEPGQSLWRLAQVFYGTGVRYTVIYDANSERIRDPDLIFPGQILTIPPAAGRP